MKKLIFIFGFLIFTASLFGQRWTQFYQTFYLDSVNTDSLLFVVQGQTTQGSLLRSTLDSMYIIEATRTAGGLTISPTEDSYLNNAESNLQAQLNAKQDTADAFLVDTTCWLLADTVVLAAFSAVDSFNTSFIYGSFYNNGSDTLVVTEMMACLQGTTPSLTVDIEWHATLGSGSATGLNSTPPTITSVTTGNSDTSFDNSEIPPGVFVWLKTPTVTTAPTFMTVTLLGYRKNSTY